MNNVYIGFLQKSFQRKYFYRANSYINILGSIFSLFIQISVWQALFRKHATVSGVTLYDMVNYVIINMVISSLIWSNAGNKMAEKVRDGSIAAAC